MKASIVPSWRSNLASLTGLVLCAASSLAQTQPPAQAPTEPASQRTISVGSNDLFAVQILAPAEVQVGDRYEYQIQVSNTSANVVLQQVVVHQQKQDGFQIEKTSIELSPHGNEPSHRVGKNSEDRNNGVNQDKNRKEQGDDDSQQNATNPEQQEEERKQDSNEWTIERLNPGETCWIRVTASSDTEGENVACVAIKSYQPAVCFQTAFVKPELDIVKTAPNAVSLCEPIEFAYYIKNDGSGETGRLTIRDELDEGLQTASGEKKLEFEVDNLLPGDTRKFVAQIRALAPGEYSSRATVEAEKGGKARSKSSPTQVSNVELAVALEGPDVEYSRRPVNFVARVTNVGDGMAPGVRLAVYGEEGVRLLRAGDPKPSKNHVKADDADGDRSTEGILLTSATTDGIAGAGAEKARGISAADKDREQAALELKVWDLQDLAPGETREVRYSVRPGDTAHVHQRAHAQFICGPAEDERQVVESVATAQTEVVSLPALLVAVVDEVDPVKVGDEVVYRILVENQGTAPDEQIKLLAELPDALEFRSVEGQTGGENDGQSVSFETLDRLGPGERATWNLRALGKEPGEVRLKVDLTSDSQEKKVRSEEPTRLFGAEQ